MRDPLKVNGWTEEPIPTAMAAAAAGAEQQKSVTLRIKIPQNKLIDNLWVAIDSVCGFMH